MKLTLASRSNHYIRRYESAAIHLGDRTLHSHSLLSPDEVIEQWTDKKLVELQAIDLAPIFALKPELVILGSGEQQEFPVPAVRNAFMAREIGVDVMTLGAACRTFNVLLSENRRVVAALFLS